jgi:hypothetical protein
LAEEQDHMTTLNNSEQQTSNWQHNGVRDAFVVASPQRAEIIDHSLVEDTYELLPSGD